MRLRTIGRRDDCGQEPRCIHIQLDSQSLESIRSCDIVRLTVLCRDKNAALNLILRNTDTGTKHGEGAAAGVWMDFNELFRFLKPGFPIVFDNQGRHARFSLEGMADNHFLGRAELLEETIIRCLERN